jgi:hypothetical protein
LVEDRRRTGVSEHVWAGVGLVAWLEAEAEVEELGRGRASGTTRTKKTKKTTMMTEATGMEDWALPKRKVAPLLLP